MNTPENPYQDKLEQWTAENLEKWASPPPKSKEEIESEIEETITLIYDKLDKPEMKLLKNAGVKEGYEEAIDILVDDKRNYTDISPTLRTVQGRAIAVLAVDYLNGECTREVLIGVPLKK